MRFTIFLAVVSAAGVASAPVDERESDVTSSTTSSSSPPTATPSETFRPEPPEGGCPFWHGRHHPRPSFGDSDSDSSPPPPPSGTSSPPPSLTFSPSPLPSEST